MLSKPSAKLWRNFLAGAGNKCRNRLLPQTIGMSAIGLPLGHPAELSYWSRKGRSPVAVITHSRKVRMRFDIVKSICKRRATLSLAFFVRQSRPDRFGVTNQLSAAGI
jgi:hypothetical protein